MKLCTTCGRSTCRQRPDTTVRRENEPWTCSKPPGQIARPPPPRRWRSRRPRWRRRRSKQAKAAGYIRVGFANEAPFGFATPDGKLTGEAPEVAKAVLAKMGITEVDGVLTEFGSLIPGLKAGRFDIIAAGMFVNPQRCAEIAFSEPSYGIGQAMLVPEGNPKGIVDYASFTENEDLKLAVMAGAVEAGYANDAGVGLGQLVIAARPVEPRRRGAGRPRRRRRADRALDRRDGAQGRRRRGDQALRRGRRQVGEGPRRLRLPQGGHRPARSLQRRARGVPRHARAHRARRALRLRRRLPAEPDHRRALRRQ